MSDLGDRNVRRIESKEQAIISATVAHMERILTRIHFLIVKSNEENMATCIQFLEYYGHDLINVPLPPHNYTAFLRAVCCGPLQLIFYMLRNGADITIQLASGESALYLAVSRVAKNTIKNPRKFQQRLLLLNYLVAAGCDVNKRTVEGFTPLHVAAKAGHISLVIWLLSKGADCNVRTVRSLKRPIDVAAQYNDTNHELVFNILNHHDLALVPQPN